MNKRRDFIKVSAGAAALHDFLVKLLRAHGLKYTDVKVAFLSPADAQAAFERNSVDAWVIWDPFFAAAQKTLGARMLADASGVVGNRAYYFSSLEYATDNPDVIRILIDEVGQIDQWGEHHRAELSAELAQLWGLPNDIVSEAIGRTQFGTGPITKAILGEQQQIADTFFELGLVPKRVNVLEAAAPGL